MSYLTTVCVLALVVQLGVAIVWRTWWTQSLLALQRSTEHVNARLDRSAATQLRVELDGLAEGVGKLSRSNRREFGRLWAEVQQLRLPIAEPFELSGDELEEPSDDAGAALVAAGGDAAKVGEAYNAMGVNRAPRTGMVCTCGWCASCVERGVVRQ